MIELSFKNYEWLKTFCLKLKIILTTFLGQGMKVDFVGNVLQDILG